MSSFIPNIKSNDIACASDFEDLGEIAHLTPKKRKRYNFKQIFFWNLAFIKFHKSWGTKLEYTLIAQLTL